MCCSSPPAPPPPPDYSKIAASSDHAADMGYQAANEDLAFRKQTYAESKPREQQLYDLASKVANQQMDIAGQNQEQANKQWQNYQNTYQPTERASAADAYGAQYLGADQNKQLSGILDGSSGLSASDAQTALRGLSTSAENAAGTEAGTRARAGTQSQYGQAVQNYTRYGGTDSGRLASEMAQMGVQNTANEVGAENQARTAARDKFVGLRTGVANFGRNMPNTAGQAFGLATQAGTSATANQNTGFMSGLPYAQFNAAGYGTQLGAAGMAGQQALGMGGVLNQGYGIQGGIYGQQAAGAGQQNGALIGGGAMIAAAFV